MTPLAPNQSYWGSFLHSCNLKVKLVILIPGIHPETANDIESRKLDVEDMVLMMIVNLQSNILTEEDGFKA